VWIPVFVLNDVKSDIAAFFFMITRDLPLPQPTWVLGKSLYEGNISLVPATAAPNPTFSQATMWFADTIPGNGYFDV
jgi:hypothetical protein